MKNKIILIIIILIILAGIGAGIFYFQKNKPAEPKIEEPIYSVDFSKAKNLLEAQLDKLKEDYAKAKEKYDKDQNDFEALMSFAFIDYQIGNYEKARDIYIKVGENSPKNYNSFWNLGNTCLKLQDFSCAENAFQKTIENGPNQSRHYIALVELYFYYIPDRKSQIPDIYKKGLENLPGDYDLLLGLAQYYREAGDKESALEYYQEIIKKYPERVEEIQGEINTLK
jgi:tetratricopeptide (TPR) repeat protein